jgi:ATP-dependent exoDNAse (exonuclease V) beta subunit
MIHIEERQRGEFIHRVLFFVEYIDEGFEHHLTEIITRVNDEMSTDYSEREVTHTIKNIIKKSTIGKFFQQLPGRIILREQEFSDRNGNLFRMDRVILDTEKITVIDYKTGHDRGADDTYGAQMKTYLKILREVYPDRPAEGIIAYVDINEFRSIV